MIARAKEVSELFPSWSWASCATEIFFQTFLPGSHHHIEDMVQVESIQPGQPLGPEAPYIAFETSSRIVLRGLLDAKFNTEQVFEQWATSLDGTMNGLEVLVSYDSDRNVKFDTDIVFDRPMPETIKHQDLRLLPIRLYCQFLFYNYL
ncbi:hypothetical protein B0H65DRAFT_575271 [Neurospora tetraspora]|uniref:Uncharacterized protein n=1 Tax=Neurospora tetraspora TaxID=94610 RepID=A0AAE0JCI2_9PEZI|nr:hypothetical protein B0H65DRAFT_575271 [Neurospora tetraspora]